MINKKLIKLYAEGFLGENDIIKYINKKYYYLDLYSRYKMIQEVYNEK